MTPKRKHEPMSDVKRAYMHILDGQPAYYSGKQVCFACRSRAIPLAKTLRQIRHEQKASDAWRQAQGFNCHFDYGWQIVKL